MNNKEYKFKTVTIKGKEYVTVNERIKYFRQNYQEWSIETRVIDLQKDSIVIQAFIKDEKGIIRSSGIAQETKGSTYINKTDHIENCETSAIGRALGILGIGIDTSIASADEMQRVEKREKQISKIDKHIDKVEQKNNKFKEQKEKLHKEEKNWLTTNLKTFFYYVEAIEGLNTVKLKDKHFREKLVYTIGKQTDKDNKIKTWRDLNSFQVQKWCERLKETKHNKHIEMKNRIKEAIEDLIKEEVEEETNKKAKEEDLI